MLLCNDTVYGSSLPDIHKDKVVQDSLVTYQGATAFPSTTLSLHTLRGPIIII